MPVRAIVLPQPDPGHAILRLAGLEAAPDGLTISIQRQQGPESHLADDGWRRTEAWLLPAHVERSRQGLDFHLGPEICDRLAGIATVRLRVKEPDIGVVGSTVVAWPIMLTSGAVDPLSHSPDDIVRLRRARAAAVPVPPPPAPPFEAEPEPPAEPPPRPIPELRAARDPLPEPKKSGAAAWLVAVLVLLLAAGGGYWAYTNYLEQKREKETASAASAPEAAAQPASVQPPAPQVGPPGKSIRNTVGEYLATKPAPEAMLAKAREFANTGEMNGAFLVWRRAAEGGNAQAELELAQFYDPLAGPPRNGFAADGQRAADWYERAALAGNAEAQRRYGQLLAKGGAGLPADPVKARSWLQQAAAQNDADAKKALSTLPK